MAEVKMVIKDNGDGSVGIVIEPSVAQLVVKAKNVNLTSGEGLALHLARRALEYSQKQAEQSSLIDLTDSPKVIIPEIKG